MIRTLALCLALTAAALAADTATAPATPAATPYPIDTCAVSGEKLGSMGEAVVLVYEGREIKFCCNGCVKTFKKDPAKYLAKIDEAAKTTPAAPAKP
jgi:YHS domain-containing protein